MAHALGEATVRELHDGLAGSLILPENPTYESARRTWNYAVDKRPAMIVRAASTADVVQTVRLARSEGRPIAVRGGGHSIAGFSTADDAIVLDLASLNDVEVDVRSRRAVVGGGATWRDFDAATQQHGLATTGGLVSSTGVGGFTLGGGIGHLVRMYGLACDNLAAAELVTADGSVLQVSESEYSDLLWALRGGGGNFGVVTAFHFDLHPVGPTVLGGVIFYPADQGREVVAGWRSLLHAVPDELTSVVVLTSAPPAPFIPEAWHGKKVVGVVSCWAGEPADGEPVVKPFRALGTPITDQLGPISYLDLQQLVDPLWTAGAANYFTSTFLDELSDEALDTLVDHHDRAAGPPVQAELHVHHLGGAVRRADAESAAFAHRDSSFVINCLARTAQPNDLPQHRAWAGEARDAVASLGPGGTYPNFAGEGGEEQLRASYPPDVLSRLQAIKDEYDPFNVFRFNLNIPPTR